jgi:DNA-directed RNA polymerase subunit RPC12/RpoP
MIKQQKNIFNIGGRTNFIVPPKEEYTCGHCGKTVAGGRYHNHCPYCLWSKHLDDKVPGDRAAECQALMEPVGVTSKKSTWRIVHQCTGCGKHTVVDSAAEDNLDLIIGLSQLPLPDNFL